MTQAQYYNCSAHDMPVMKTGDTVRIRPFVPGQKSWDKADVNRKFDERSYEVQSAGIPYRPNKQNLVKTVEPLVQQDPTERAEVVAKIESD